MSISTEMAEIDSDSPDKSPESRWEDEPCWGCGSKGDHPEWGGHYWPCGTMKSASIRGEQCYETEITRLKGLVREMGSIIKRGERRGEEILSRPEVRAILEEK